MRVTHPCGCWPPAQHISRLTPLAPVGFRDSSSLQPCRAGAACQGLLPRRHAVPPPLAVPAAPGVRCPFPPPTAACAAAPLAPLPGGRGCRGVPSPLTRRRGGCRPRAGRQEPFGFRKLPGQKNKSRGKLGSRTSRQRRARCGRSRRARVSCRAPLSRPHGPADHQDVGASPAAAVAPLPPCGWARVKGGGTGYTLTAAPRHLPPAASHDG